MLDKNGDGTYPLGLTDADIEGVRVFMTPSGTMNLETFALVLNHYLCRKRKQYRDAGIPDTKIMALVMDGPTCHGVSQDLDTNNPQHPFVNSSEITKVLTAYNCVAVIYFHNSSTIFGILDRGPFRAYQQFLRKLLNTIKLVDSHGWATLVQPAEGKPWYPSNMIDFNSEPTDSTLQGVARLDRTDGLSAVRSVRVHAFSICIWLKWERETADAVARSGCRKTGYYPCDIDQPLSMCTEVTSQQLRRYERARAVADASQWVTDAMLTLEAATKESDPDGKLALMAEARRKLAPPGSTQHHLEKSQRLAYNQKQSTKKQKSVLKKYENEA